MLDLHALPVVLSFDLGEYVSGIYEYEWGQDCVSDWIRDALNKAVKYLVAYVAQCCILYLTYG